MVDYKIFKNFDPNYSLLLASAATASNLSSENSVDGVGIIKEVFKLESKYGRLDI